MSHPAYKWKVPLNPPYIIWARFSGLPLFPSYIIEADFTRNLPLFLPYIYGQTECNSVILFYTKCCDDELPFQHYYSSLSHYRKPDKSEIEEPLEPCPYCAHPVPQTKLDCPQCKNNIPYCIVTVSVENRTCSF